MQPKPITEILDIAKAEHAKQLNDLTKIRQQISCEEFKTLFIIRAHQAMADRKNFNQFIIDDDNREVINMMYAYITMNMNGVFNPFIGIVLNGRYGCGKSVLIEAFCMVLNDLIFREKNKIESIHSIELAEQIKRVGVIPYARKPLLIQDIGKEKKEINNFGTIVNPIAELLAIRAEYGALTFGSTNMDTPAFKEAYKESISKRLTEHINLVFLPGTDRRPNFSINQPK